jgi:uncharacterized membrane protein YheB (UPF0754 family)
MDSSILFFIAPPLIGAFIGYLTNRIAIRMLFRPLRAWYIFGFKVPMTPGVIPGKRKDLAVNIGDMVGGHLLTGRDVGTALSRESFQEHLHTLLDGRIESVLEKDFGSLLSFVPERFKGYAKVGLRALKKQIKNGANSYLKSDSFAELFVRVVDEQLGQYGEKELESIVTVSDRKRFYGFFDGLLKKLVESPALEDWLSLYLRQRLDEAVVQKKTLRDILPDELVNLLFSGLRKQAPGLMGRLAELIGEPDMRNRIVAGILAGVDHFLLSLGPMAAMAKSFIDPKGLEEKIRSYLEDHEEEIAEWLQSPEVQGKVADALIKHADKFLHKPIGELVERVSAEQLDSICGELARQLLVGIRSPAAATAFSELLGRSCDEMVEHGRKTLAEIGSEFFPDQQGVRLRENFERELLAMFHSPATGRVVGRMIDNMVDTLTNHKVGTLTRLLPIRVRRSVTEYLALLVNRILMEEVPGIVKSLQISKLIEDKVNSLDLLKLERLLLSIMEEQFKYINLFGALLGFIIGLLNLVILQLG